MGRRTQDAAIEEDPADILDVSLSSLFDIAPIAFSTSNPASLHTYEPPAGSALSKPIPLRLPSPSADVFTKLQANHLWLSAIFLADQIALGAVPVSGLRIAELGAAAGLPGITACALGAEVVGTDWGDEGILSALQDNFGRSCEQGRWAVMAHEWGSDLAPLLGARRTEPTRFDALLLADTLWVTDAHGALLDSVFGLLRPGGVAHVTAGLHTGRGPLERFVKAAEGRGGVVKQEREVRWCKEGRWEDNSASKGGLKEERGVVVYMTLTTPS